MMIYCNNDPCESEATKVAIWPNGDITSLCSTCYQAFELGSAYESHGDWEIWSILALVDRVVDLADDAGIKITRGEAEYIIDRSQGYDSLDTAITVLTMAIREDEKWHHADLACDEARGT